MMNIARSHIERIKISDVPGLDPVTVFLEDDAPGKGKIIIECYSQSWSAYWGAMGDGGVAEFFCTCDEHYLAGKLSSVSGNVPDYDALVGKARKEVIRKRRDNELPSDEARALYDNASRLSEGVDYNRELMQQVFGDEWWHDIPNKKNPDYEYLCRIVNTVKEALASLGYKAKPEPPPRPAPKRMPR